MKLRAILVLWHRWFGLAAALWLTLLALTGSIIVFYDELDTALNPDLRLVAPVGEPAPLDLVRRTAEARFAGSYASFIDLPRTPQESVRVFLASRDDAEAGPPGGASVFVDPYTAEALGDRLSHVVSLGPRHVMDFLYELHIDLHLGGWMVWLLGLVALLWIVDHIASAILSFPTPRKWAQSFGVRRGASGHKLVFDLHRAGGLWLAPVTLVLAVSGLYFNWMETFEGAVSAASPLTPRHFELVEPLPEPLYDPPVDLDQAFAAIAAVSQAPIQIDMVSLRPRQGIYEARVYDLRDIDSYGRRYVTVDARTGVVLDDRHVTEGTAGDVFLAWQYPLHSGKAFGWPGRILIFLSGLTVAGLSITGVTLWARKQAARRGAGRPGRGRRPERG